MSTEIRRVGRYELQERLTHTNSSELWRAYDPQLRKHVALKLLATQTRGDSEYPKRFIDEITALIPLRHPNIVPLYDARIFSPPGAETTLAYITTEYIQGQTLTDRIQTTQRTGRSPHWDEIVHLFISICTTIEYAHEQGVVHGDLKPNNILLRPNSNYTLEPIITDFGLPRILGSATNAHTRRSLDAILYISPEQAKGGPPDERSDIYSLAVMLYEMCTGMVPFQGSRPISILMQHAQAVPPSPTLIAPTIPPGLTHVIMRGLAKKPEDRFANASVMALALTNAIHGNALMNIQEEFPLSSYPYAGNTSLAHSMGQEVALKEHIQSTQPVFIERRRRRRRQNAGIGLSLIVIMALLVTGLGVFLSPKGSASTTSATGHAAFISTGKVNVGDGLHGLNDELQIDVTGIAPPSTTQSYYGWLLPDKTLSESAPISLGKLTVTNGAIHLLYAGTQDHRNLLASTSRFLITQESATIQPTIPSVDTKRWQYYAEVPQVVGPAGGFSMLNHFRHLLVDLPELQTLNLHGGLTTWLLQNSHTVATLAAAAKAALLAHNYALARENSILILDYLDGRSYVQNDLPPEVNLPTGTMNDEIPLLSPNPQSTDAVGYIRLVGLHLTGMLSLSPATQAQRQSGSQIITTLDTVRDALQQTRDDAKMLATLDDTQFAQPSTSALVDDMVTQTQGAYTGKVNQKGQQVSGGTMWVYNAIQHLVNFTIVRYVSSN